MKRLLLSAAFSCIATGTFATCITDRGPYQDGSGAANFPFYNSCDENIMVSLCVKSSGGGETIFNSYQAVANRFSTVTIIGGKWSTFNSYRWNEGQNAPCPFF